MAQKLDNYLRTHRRRAGLTQDEVAFLLGTRSGTKVSRYERLRRQPTLETAFAYEVIFGAPCRELFAGTYDNVERDIVARVRRLVVRLQSAGPSRADEQKLAALRATLAAPKRNAA